MAIRPVLERGRRHVILGAVVFASVFAPHLRAEFYVWQDPAGRRQVSTIPRQGFASDGGVRRAYNPHSIVYQRRQLVDTLKRQAADLARKQELAAPSSKESTAPVKSAGHQLPRGDLMDLQELNALEKRTGRADVAMDGQGAAGSRSK
jgi:hypothetical protein